MATAKGMRSFPSSCQKWGGNMEKSFLLARSNLRRAKGQTAAIVVLVFLASAMLNLWLMLSTDYRQNFDRCHDRLHAEHVAFAVDRNDKKMQEFFEGTLRNDSRTEAFSTDTSMHMAGVFSYNDGEINSEFVFMEKEAALSRTVGRTEIVEEDSRLTSGIYMPILYKSEENAIGKSIELSVGNRKISYTICGFFNNVMTGSHNCGMCGILLTEDKYRELEEAGCAPEALFCSVRLKDKSESQDYEAMLKNEISAHFPAVRMVSTSYALVAQSRYISQMICAGILSAMAFLVLLIALVVMASNIVNDIQENMKNLGALKAMGYTSLQLVFSLLLQFLGLSLIIAAAGAGFSYTLFPTLNSMMISQTGIPYKVHFLPIPFLLTLLTLGGAVFLAVWFSSGRIRKIEPITALRQGVLTHSFKRNHVPLEETRFPLHFALAMKTTLSGIKHNLTICITMLTLSLVAVFSGLMIENMIADMNPFLNLIVGETADSCINVNQEAEEEFLQRMHSDERVEKVYLYHTVEVRHVGGVGLMATICDDFGKVNNRNVVFEGRFPKYDNEIAIAAKYAREKGLEPGNEIILTAEGKKAEYIITGFTQVTNNLGKDCLLTRQGYERLGRLTNAGYYLNLSEDSDIDQFHAEIKKLFGADVNITININEILEGSTAVYVSLMKAIVILVLVLSMVVIVFVLYLLVRTMLGNKKRDYGILKALGFTTGQLILQTALSFMPAIVISTIIGISVCSFIINPLTAVFMSGIGIVKCTFTVPAEFNILAGLGMILFAFGASCLLSLKIRKTQPVGLLM